MNISRIASLTLALTLCLMMLGGLVHSTGSSLACPDWPLCYGQVFPEMKGGVLIEHSHRLLASLVGLLTILLFALSCRKSQSDRGLTKICGLALALVIFQGLLGGLTVIYQLPTAVSTAHLGTSMLFLSTIFWILLRSDFGPTQGQALPGFLKLALVALYLQILLGALVRHTGAAIVCPDIPLCFGMLWPVDLHPTTRLHMLHRMMAVVVTFILIAAGLRMRRAGRPLNQLGIATALLVCVQVMLGIMSVLTKLAVVAVTAHLAIAAMLLLVLVAASYFYRRGALS